MNKTAVGIVGWMLGLFATVALAQEGIPGTNARLDQIDSTLGGIRSAVQEIRDAGVPPELTGRLDELIALVDEIKDASSLGPIGDRLDIAIDRLEDIRDALSPGSSPIGLVQSYTMGVQIQSLAAINDEPGQIIQIGGNRRAVAAQASFTGGERLHGPGEFGCGLEICVTVPTGVCDGTAFAGPNRIRVIGTHFDSNVRIDFPAPMAVYAIGTRPTTANTWCNVQFNLFYIDD